MEILSVYIGGFAVVHTKHRGKHDVNGVLTDTSVLTMHCSGVTGVQQFFWVCKRRHTCPWAVSSIAGQSLHLNGAELQWQTQRMDKRGAVSVQEANPLL